MTHHVAAIATVLDNSPSFHTLHLYMYTEEMQLRLGPALAACLRQLEVGHFGFRTGKDAEALLAAKHLTSMIVDTSVQYSVGKTVEFWQVLASAFLRAVVITANGTGRAWDLPSLATADHLSFLSRLTGLQSLSILLAEEDRFMSRALTA